MKEECLATKQFIFKGLVSLLEKEGNSLTLGDKVIIRDQVNEYVENHFKTIGEIFPAVPGNVYYMVYLNLKNFGFKISFLDKWGNNRVNECTRYADKVKLIKKVYGEDVVYA